MAESGNRSAGDQPARSGGRNSNGFAARVFGATAKRIVLVEVILLVIAVILAWPGHNSPDVTMLKVFSSLTIVTAIIIAVVSIVAAIVFGVRLLLARG